MPSIMRVSYGKAHVEQPFTVERAKPRLFRADQIHVYGHAVLNVLEASWRAKFVPEVLSEDDLSAKMPSISRQAERIAFPERDASYWVAHNDDPLYPNLVSADKAQAILRIETYHPRRWRNRPYPNITDLETLNGQLSGQYENHTAALIYFGLADYNPDGKVATYSEEPNTDGINFMENLGFHRTGNQPTELIGQSFMTYVHLEAESVGSVRRSLEQQYSWLNVDDMV